MVKKSFKQFDSDNIPKKIEISNDNNQQTLDDIK